MSSWVEVSLNTPAQLSLPLYLPDDETFASFWPGDNASLLAALQNVLRQEHSGYIYLWAREGAGRSHLLHAACAELSQRGDAVGYVPLDKRTWFVPEVLGRSSAKTVKSGLARSRFPSGLGANL